MLAEHGAQGRLRQHVRRRKIVLHLDDRPLGIDDIEIEHCVDFHRDVVARDHVLAGDLDDLDAQVHPHHFLYERDQKHEARALDPLKPSEREHHGPLVFAQDAHRGGQAYDDDEGDDGNEIG